MDNNGILPADWIYLLNGLVTTIWISALTFVVGLLIAIFHTNVRLFQSLGMLRVPMTIYVETIRSTPLLVQLLLVFFGLPLIGLDLSPATTAVLVLSLYSGAYLSGIIWGAVESVPKTQWEVSISLGLKRRHILGLFIFPQALRVVLPSATGFAVTLIKGSTLVSVIGFVDLARAAGQINEVTFQPSIIYGAVTLGYFAVCFPLSVLSQRLEGKVRAR